MALMNATPSRKEQMKGPGRWRRMVNVFALGLSVVTIPTLIKPNTAEAAILLVPTTDAPAQAQDTKDHFFGKASVSFRGYNMLNWQPKTCNFTADVEVKSPATLAGSHPWESAFSYTLRNLAPVTTEDGFCYFQPYSGDFVAICRAYSLSVGSIGLDIPQLGTLQVSPHDPAVKQWLSSDSLKVGRWGFSVTRLWYRLSVLEDGGLEVLACVPRGWDPKALQ